MTAEELRVMDKEDNDLRQLMKGHWYEEDEEIPVRDQPTYYSDKLDEEDEEEVSRLPLENYWEPVGVNVPEKLRASAFDSIFPAACAFATWAFSLSGDISKSLATTIIVTCVLIAAALLVRPWLED